MPRETTFWAPGADPVDVGEDTRAAAFGDGFFWTHWVAPPNPLPRRSTVDVDATARDHAPLLRRLAALGLVGPGSETTDEPSATRMRALGNVGLWMKPDGLWRPGIHPGHGVVTASATALADDEIRNIFGCTAGLLSRSTSVIVFPRCLVTITWPPLIALKETPSDDAWRCYLEALDETRYFGTDEDHRTRVARAWREAGWTQSGDLAVLLLKGLVATVTPAVRELVYYFFRREAMLGDRAAPDTAPSSDEALECHHAIAILMRDLAALRKYEGTMRYATPALVQDLKGDCDNALSEARTLWRDLRVSLDAATLQISIDEQRRAGEERDRADKHRDLVAYLSAIFVPLAFWATIYGANVTLPGQDQPSGARILLALMIGSAVICVVLIELARRGAFDRTAKAS